MTPDLVQILSGVKEDMNEHLRGLQKLGPSYARAYAEFFASSRQNPPRVPAGLPLEAAAAIRESVRDRAMVVRCSTRTIEHTPRRAARDRALSG
ncbi:MAG: hypothetical protein M3340_08665 [Actinomycetota bacterium]|nr:hypothetical protein [Actinomycetota bacterium]